MKRLLQQRNSVRLSMCYDNVAFSKEQLALLEERDQAIGDLQFSLDERTAELEEVMGRMWYGLGKRWGSDDMDWGRWVCAGEGCGLGRDWGRGMWAGEGLGKRGVCSVAVGLITGRLSLDSHCYLQIS